MSSKYFLATIFLVSSLNLASAQPSQEMPHRVFGAIEDTQGNTMTDAEVEVVFDGEKLASDTTNEDGYYDITVPFEGNYEGEKFELRVRGSPIKEFVYSSGKIEEIDLTVEASQEENDTDEEQAPSGAGGGGVAGAPVSTDEVEDASNNTEKVNDGNNETSNTTEIVEESNSTSDSTEDSEDSETDTDTQDSQDGDSLTGAFISSTSSVGEFAAGIIDSILNPINSMIKTLFG